MENLNKVYRSEKVLPIETNVEINLHLNNNFSIFNTRSNRALMIELLNEYLTNKFERAI